MPHESIIDTNMCPRCCRMELQRNNFYTVKGKRDYWCKQCRIEVANLWQKQNRERRAARERNRRLQQRENEGRKRWQRIKKPD